MKQQKESLMAQRYHLQKLSQPPWNKGTAVCA